MVDLSYSIRKLLFDTSRKQLQSNSKHFSCRPTFTTYLQGTSLIPKLSVICLKVSFRSVNSQYGYVDVLAAVVA